MGRHLMRRLIDEGHDVLGLDHDLVTFHNEEPNMKYAELLSGSPWPMEFEGVEVVFHLAAEAPPDGIRRIQTLEHNATVDMNVFRAAKIFRVKRVIYASSVTIEEEMTPYSTSKRVGELLLDQYAFDHEAIRFCNIFGPGQRKDFIVPKFINQALGDGIIKVRGEGTHSRRFLYVEQAIDMYMGAMIPTGLKHDGYKMTMLDLAIAIQDIDGAAEIDVETLPVGGLHAIDIPDSMCTDFQETYDHYQSQLATSPVN